MSTIEREQEEEFSEAEYVYRQLVALVTQTALTELRDVGLKDSKQLRENVLRVAEATARYCVRDCMRDMDAWTRDFAERMLDWGTKE